MSKRKSIMSDGFDNWLTGDSPQTDQRLTPAPTSHPESPSFEADRANLASRLTGRARPFTVHIDGELLVQLDVIKAELRRMTDKGAHETSKRLIVEAALINLLDDFLENKDRSFLFQYIDSK